MWMRGKKVIWLQEVHLWHTYTKYTHTHAHSSERERERISTLLLMVATGVYVGGRATRSKPLSVEQTEHTRDSFYQEGSSASERTASEQTISCQQPMQRGTLHSSTNIIRVCVEHILRFQYFQQSRQLGSCQFCAYFKTVHHSKYLRTQERQLAKLRRLGMTQTGVTATLDFPAVARSAIAHIIFFCCSGNCLISIIMACLKEVLLSSNQHNNSTKYALCISVLSSFVRLMQNR